MASDTPPQPFAAELAALNEAVEGLRHASMTDPLTGLRNGGALQALLANALVTYKAQWPRPVDPHCAMNSPVLCFADLNGFKDLNEHHGYGAGDAALREVARKLKALGRDMICHRIQGDEFALVFAEPDPLPTGHVPIDYLLSQQFEQVRFMHDGKSLEVRIAFGISGVPDDSNVETWKRQAIDASKAAKLQGGSGKVVRWSPQLQVKTEERRLRCCHCGAGVRVEHTREQLQKELLCPCCRKGIQ